MDVLQFTFFAALAGGGIALLYILLARPTTGSALLAAMLSAGFGAYTAVQIAVEGIVPFFTNHTANMTGLQVWIDLIMCLVVGVFLIAPRARAAGMNIVPWVLFASATASIGLLAMCARLFWLESRMQTQPDTKPQSATETQARPQPAVAPRG